MWFLLYRFCLFVTLGKSSNSGLSIISLFHLPLPSPFISSLHILSTYLITYTHTHPPLPSPPISSPFLPITFTFVMIPPISIISLPIPQDVPHILLYFLFRILFSSIPRSFNSIFQKIVIFQKQNLFLNLTLLSFYNEDVGINIITILFAQCNPFLFPLINCHCRYDSLIYILISRCH